jgi:hypothetical protein
MPTDHGKCTVTLPRPSLAQLFSALDEECGIRHYSFAVGVGRGTRPSVYRRLPWEPADY